MAKEYYQLIRSFGGLSLEYTSISESDFAAPSGAAYTPPERGEFRRIAGEREIQILSECPGVLETFQNLSGSIFLPANTYSEDTNDAGNGRMFFMKNSGLSDVYIKDYLGTLLYTVPTDVDVIIVGNNNNNWDIYRTQGETGIQGCTGPLGQTGVQGIQGNTGLIGETGVQGIQGVTGLIGATGVQGIQGNTGPLGQTGVQGNTGPLGQTGISGVTGLIGATGIQGITGLIGPTGIQGLTGITGFTGIQGVTGFSLKLKSGTVTGASFSGNPKKYTVTFGTSFPSTTYTVTILGVAVRSWTYESKTASGFVINSNANTALANEVSWQAIYNGES